VRRRPRELDDAQWYFDEVPAKERRFACIWEFGRESELLRSRSGARRGADLFKLKADALKGFKWTEETLLFSRFMGCVRPDERLHVPWTSVAERCCALKPQKHRQPIEPLIGLDWEGWDLLTPLSTARKDEPHRSIRIYLGAPKMDILKAVDAFVDREREILGIGSGRGKNKSDDWLDRLNALGTWRLRQAGNTFSQIANMRFERDSKAEPKSLERQAQRHIKEIALTFGKVYPSLPVPKRMRGS
jgi:hypothetical protein